MCIDKELVKYWRKLANIFFFAGLKGETGLNGQDSVYKKENSACDTEKRKSPHAYGKVRMRMVFLFSPI